MEKKLAKISLFCCANSIDSSELSVHGDSVNVDIKVIQIPCSGKIDILYLTKSFETGAEGVVIVTCKKGECKFLEGNLRAKKRARAVEKLLEEIGIDGERIAVIEKGDGGVEQLMREIESFSNRIASMPEMVLSGSEKSPNGKVLC